MSWYKPWTWGDDSESAIKQRDNLDESGNQASQFADQAQGNYGAMTQEANAARDYLRKIATGQESVSAEQLRQGLQQNQAAQRSMAASASPANAAMAARTAMIQSGRLGAGLAGQQAIAGLQERQAAQKALADMIMQQRGQDVQAGLGSRGNAINAYGGIKPEGSLLDKWGSAATAALSLAGGGGGKPKGK